MGVVLSLQMVTSIHSSIAIAYLFSQSLTLFIFLSLFVERSKLKAKVNCVLDYQPRASKGMHYFAPQFDKNGNLLKRGQFTSAMFGVFLKNGKYIKQYDELVLDYGENFWREYEPYCTFCFYKFKKHERYVQCTVCFGMWHPVAACAGDRLKQPPDGEWLCQLCASSPTSLGTSCLSIPTPTSTLLSSTLSPPSSSSLPISPFPSTPTSILSLSSQTTEVSTSDSFSYPPECVRRTEAQLASLSKGSVGVAISPHCSFSDPRLAIVSTSQLSAARPFVAVGGMLGLNTFSRTVQPIAEVLRTHLLDGLSADKFAELQKSLRPLDVSGAVHAVVATKDPLLYTALTGGIGGLAESACARHANCEIKVYDITGNSIRALFPLRDLDPGTIITACGEDQVSCLMCAELKRSAHPAIHEDSMPSSAKRLKVDLFSGLSEQTYLPSSSLSAPFHPSKIDLSFPSSSSHLFPLWSSSSPTDSSPTPLLPSPSSPSAHSDHDDTLWKRKRDALQQLLGTSRPVFIGGVFTSEEEEKITVNLRSALRIDEGDGDEASDEDEADGDEASDEEGKLADVSEIDDFGLSDEGGESEQSEEGSEDSESDDDMDEDVSAALPNLLRLTVKGRKRFKNFCMIETTTQHGMCAMSALVMEEKRHTSTEDWDSVLDMYKRLTVRMLNADTDPDVHRIDTTYTHLSSTCTSDVTIFRMEAAELLKGSWPGPTTLKMAAIELKRPIVVYTAYYEDMPSRRRGTTSRPAAIECLHRYSYEPHADVDAGEPIHLLYNEPKFVENESKAGHYRLLLTGKRFPTFSSSCASPSKGSFLSALACFRLEMCEQLTTDELDTVQAANRRTARRAPLLPRATPSKKSCAQVAPIPEPSCVSTSSSSSESGDSLSSHPSSSSSSSSDTDESTLSRSPCFPSSLRRSPSSTRTVPDQYDRALRFVKDRKRRKTLSKKLSIPAFNKRMAEVRGCCGDNCGTGRVVRSAIGDASVFMDSFVYSELISLLQQPYEQRKQILAEKCAPACERQKHMNFRWHNEVVCRLCLANLLGVGVRSLLNHRKKDKQSNRGSEHGNKRSNYNRRSWMYRQVYSALASIVKRDAQCMPNARRGQGDLGMPQGTMREIVDEVQSIVNERCGTSPSKSLVYLVLRNDFPHVTCPKDKTLLRCGTCDALKELIKQAETEEEKNLYREHLEGHRIEQYDQRKKYWRACERVN